MKSDLDSWFVSEVLPHEAALTRFLRKVWFNVAEIPDLRQEIYVRVYESARNRVPTSPRAFIFAIARNLLADRMRRDRVVSINYTQDLEALHVLVDEISPERQLNARQELLRLYEVLDSLPDGCREVIWLRRVVGLSQREAARRLAMNEGTLESHLCRGLKILAAALFEQERDGRKSAAQSAHGIPNERQ